MIKEKDFDGWNAVKKATDQKNSHRYYRAGEVWWCSFGTNIGFEMDGKGEKYLRPILVIRGFSREMCIAVPLTMKQKKSPFHHAVTLDDGIERNAVLSQSKTIDTKRLLERIGTVSEQELASIQKALRRLIV